MSLAYAGARIRARPGRALLAALGIAAAAAMLAAAVTVGYGLGTGFDRAAARAHMPDVIARFDQRDLESVRARVDALPNLASASYVLEERRVHIWQPGGPVITSAQVEGVTGRRNGYAIVAGRDLSGHSGEVLVERGLAQERHVEPGDTIRLAAPAGAEAVRRLRVVGVAVAPDNVAYPLASEARVWMPYAAVRAAFAPGQGHPVDEALLWARDRSQLDVMLEQARAASFGVGGLVFVTRSGVRVLIDQAAGIVISLLVAFSLVALAGAGIMLAASSRAEVERRLEAIAAIRAVGGSRRSIVASAAFEAALVAAPAAAAGMLAGWAAARGPSDRLLETLNQFPPAWDLLPPLALCFAAVVCLVAATTAWPVWRACRRQVAPMLRGAEVGGTPRGRLFPAGTAGLGMRMIAARPVRTLATAAVLAASAAVVLLMLALASLLDALEHDPGSVGKRYQLTAHGSAPGLDRIAALPGVAAAAQRFTVDVADSYQLGETFQLIAYCGDRLQFEAPPLASGRRAVHPGEVEVGEGLAAALGLRPGATLAAQFPDGDEGRFRVVGVVRVLDNDGRIAYAQPRISICDFHGGTTVVRVAGGASKAAVAAELDRTGRPAESVGGVTTRNASFLGVLAGLLRTIAAVDGLVCLYAVVQMLALTAYERRAAVAVLRACGAGRAQVTAVFAGAALLLAVLATPVAIVAERTVIGPAAAGLAASYAAVSLRAGAPAIAVTVAGLGCIALAAAAWVARGTMRTAVIAAIRGE